MSEKKMVEVDFKIGQEVKINVNSIVGKINGIWIDVSRISYIFTSWRDLSCTTVS